MVKSSIATYLRQDGKTLGKLLVKVNQLKQWNSWLHECLTEESTLLEHCQIVSIDKGALIIIADSAHWVTRFRFHIPQLLIKLRHYPDFAALKAICCKVRPADYSSITTAQKTPERKISLSSKNAAALQNAADKIENKRLKAVLERIAQHGEKKIEAV